jgi:hypothetical protein
MRREIGNKNGDSGHRVDFLCPQGLIIDEMTFLCALAVGFKLVWIAFPTKLSCKSNKGINQLKRLVFNSCS